MIYPEERLTISHIFTDDVIMLVLGEVEDVLARTFVYLDAMMHPPLNERVINFIQENNSTTQRRLLI